MLKAKRGRLLNLVGGLLTKKYDDTTYEVYTRITPYIITAGMLM